MAMEITVLVSQGSYQEHLSHLRMRPTFSSPAGVLNMPLAGWLWGFCFWLMFIALWGSPQAEFIPLPAPLLWLGKIFWDLPSLTNSSVPWAFVHIFPFLSHSPALVTHCFALAISSPKEFLHNFLKLAPPYRCSVLPKKQKKRSSLPGYPVQNGYGIRVMHRQQLRHQTKHSYSDI